MPPWAWLPRRRSAVRADRRLRQRPLRDRVPREWLLSHPAGASIVSVARQGHLDTQYGYPDMQNNLQRFADLGREIALTDVDIRTFVTEKNKGTYTNTRADPAEAAQQVDWWVRTLEACLAVEACNSFTVWGVSDANSWIPGWFTGQGAGLLYDMHNNPKAQYEALRKVLRNAA